MTIAAGAQGAYVVAATAKDLILAGWSTVAVTSYLESMGVEGLAAPESDNIWLSERRPPVPTIPGIGLFVRDTQTQKIDGLGAQDQVHSLEIQVWASDSQPDGLGGWITSVDGVVMDEQVVERVLRAYCETIVLILESSNLGFTNYDLRTSGTTGIYRCDPARGFGPQRFVETLDDTTSTYTQQTVIAQVAVWQRRPLL